MLQNNKIRPPSSIKFPILSIVFDKVRSLLGGDRFNNLYFSIQNAIESLKIPNPILLDYGCGNLSLAYHLKKNGCIKDFIGIDTYEKPFFSDIDTNLLYKNYLQIDKNVNFNLANNYDVCIMVDVLHHIDESERVKILKNIQENSDFLIIKDHLEHSLVSRYLLRLADFFGNYAYGVTIPKKYFTREAFLDLMLSAGYIEIQFFSDVKIHDGLFGFIIKKKYHFISILVKNDRY